MGKIETSLLPVRIGASYPPPHDDCCRARELVQLSIGAGLTQFGVNRIRLKPSAWSSLRHWHAKEDEFVFVLEGEPTLVTEAGEELLRPGDCAGFRAGVRDAHCLQNRTSRDVVFLAIGTRDDADWGEYPDVGLRFLPGRYSAPVRFSKAKLPDDSNQE